MPLMIKPLGPGSFWENKAVEAVEASEGAEAAEVNEAAVVSKAWKITIEDFSHPGSWIQWSED